MNNINNEKFNNNEDALKKTSSIIKLVFGCIMFVIVLIGTFNSDFISNFKTAFNSFDNNFDNSIDILSSYENQDLENSIQKYAKKNKININFKYMGDLDIVTELNNHKENYDGVWISNSIWLYMLDNPYLTSESKSISISPVVMGLKKNKAKELNLINKNITNKDILNLIKNKQIKYVMSSVTQTNTGATAYLGFLNTLAGSPEVLTMEMLDNPKLMDDMKNVFSGVERVSGDEEYLESMFINDNKYEAIIASEASLININKKLKRENKEELYLLYPIDGVALNDSTFAYIKNDETKKEDFLKIQKYLLNEQGQEKLQNLGRRTWYGGVKEDVNKKVFDIDNGIDTNKYLAITKFPSKKVMTKAINKYIEEFRKPTHVVFCLDYSGSMAGNGIYELKNAMDYILTYEKAAKDKLQFSRNDKITVIPFSNNVENIWSSSGQETLNLMNNINSKSPYGATALYDAIIEGLNILKNESSDYTTTIITMTDGLINRGSYYDLKGKYILTNKTIPIYNIMFGDASRNQLEEIAKLSNSKVFDGRKELLEAFKEVRGYN